MGRAPCCDKATVKKGTWSPEEDATLKSYIEKNGTGGNWIGLPQKIGLKRCGKSCRLRWLNYLRPNIKHGGFTEQEDNIICHLYLTIGSRWSIIANYLSERTDNDIKNYWNTKLKKKLLGKQKKEKSCINQDLMIKQENHESNSPYNYMVPITNQQILTNSYLPNIPSTLVMHQNQINPHSTSIHQYSFEQEFIRGTYNYPFTAGSSFYQDQEFPNQANSMNSTESTSCSQALNTTSTDYNSSHAYMFQDGGGLRRDIDVELDEFVFQNSQELERYESLFGMDMPNNIVGSSNTSVESSSWGDITSVVNYPQQLLLNQFETTYPTHNLPQFDSSFGDSGY